MRAALGAAILGQAALAQEQQQPELTPAGKAMLKGLLPAPVRIMSDISLTIRVLIQPTYSPCTPRLNAKIFHRNSFSGADVESGRSAMFSPHAGT